MCYKMVPVVELLDSHLDEPSAAVSVYPQNNKGFHH